MSDKKRATTRVEFHTRGELHYGGKTVSGSVENLSLKGMLFVPEEPAEDLTMSAEVDVQISLTGTGSSLSFGLEGKVVRIGEKGVGIRFTEMEFDSFVHLRNIVAYNTGNEDKIMEEFHDAFEE